MLLKVVYFNYFQLLGLRETVRRPQVTKQYSTRPAGTRWPTFNVAPSGIRDEDSPQCTLSKITVGYSVLDMIEQ